MPATALPSRETRARTVARAITYRLSAWVVTVPITWWMTGNVWQAFEASTVLHLVLSCDYYIHERIWLRVRWGLRSDRL